MVAVLDGTRPRLYLSREFPHICIVASCMDCLRGV